ncbi:MAG: hypothetical protein AAF202_10200, partial [Pseudomonadota bacterium]
MRIVLGALVFYALHIEVAYGERRDSFADLLEAKNAKQIEMSLKKWRRDRSTELSCHWERSNHHPP